MFLRLERAGPEHEWEDAKPECFLVNVDQIAMVFSSRYGCMVNGVEVKETIEELTELISTRSSVSWVDRDEEDGV